jgi:CPA2 family monovalent cation:H+ antiporter-2
VTCGFFLLRFISSHRCDTIDAVAMNVSHILMASGAADISPLFGLLTMVLLLAVFVSLVMARLRQSLLVGYFLCGILIANSGVPEWLGMDTKGAIIPQLAELGIVLLMFTLGVEFSIRELRHLWRLALFGGGLQVGITASLAGGIAAICGRPWEECLLIGIIFALSSTAVSLKSFQDQGISGSPGAKAALGIALFQDILVIGLFLVLPALLGNSAQSMGREIVIALLKGSAFLAGAALLGRFGINPLLHAVAKTRSRELFTLTIIGMSAGVAYAGGAMDLSLALGAFAGGLMVSESIYSHRIMTDILPFKDLFLTIFFVSVGLMIDTKEVWANLWIILAGTLVIFSVKFITVFGVVRLLRLPLRPALLAAASLASVGEFSLVLIQKSNEYRPFDPWLEQTILICTALGMAMIPGTMIATSPFSAWLERKGWFRSKRVTPGKLDLSSSIKGLEDHAVICGYGPVGQAVHQAMLGAGVECVVVDLNADTVRQLKKQGVPVLFGDVTHPEALALAKIKRARLIAFTFPQVHVTKLAIPLVLQENPTILVLARAKFSTEALELSLMGARVIHDENESAQAMVDLGMSAYEKPLG